MIPETVGLGTARSSPLREQVQRSKHHILEIQKQEAIFHKLCGKVREWVEVGFNRIRLTASQSGESNGAAARVGTAA